MRLIVGLGNPGDQYARTRHNIGFRVLDSLGLDFHKGFQGLYAKSGDLIYLKPQTFMNRSGDSVLAALSFHKIKPEDLLVIHDELDLPFGTVRLKKSGGHAGHNGLRDIIRVIGPEFNRIRMGIGKPENKNQVADYVLSPFSSLEENQLLDLIQQTISILHERI
ncbi:MAG: aminoacyl-tRNA hydrolase [Myxococcaceae bacterium]